MTLSPENRPAFGEEPVRRLLAGQYGLEGDLSPMPAEWDQNFRLDAGESGLFVVKIASRGHAPEVLDLQTAALDWLASRPSPCGTPSVVRTRSGAATCTLSDAAGRRHLVRVITWIDGRPLSETLPCDLGTLERLGEAVGRLDEALREFTHPGMVRDLPWDLAGVRWISAHTHRIENPERRGIVEGLLLQYRGRVEPGLADLPRSVIHNDANDENVLVTGGGESGWRIAGFLDFGDMLLSRTVNDLAIASAYACFRAEDPLESAARIASGYHRERPLTAGEIRVLFPLICMRLCASVTTSAMAAADDPENAHRTISDSMAWDLLERIRDRDWDEAARKIGEACGVEAGSEGSGPAAAASGEDILERRRERIGPSLSLSYRTPLVIVRGQGTYLFEPGGRACLDCVNNVCHVGHAHPKVAGALSRQAALLNTNTRYLHPLIVEYAERLTATLPEPLRVCHFVNSGSEANDLAVRMARTHTGRADVIVLEGGYHGHTGVLVALSPYKSEGPGGEGLPSWAHKVPKPDPYRGPHRGAGPEAGRKYAGYVAETCRRLAGEGRPPALFLCEPLLGCGGQIVPPEGYLREAFARAREAGAVCIADEVQVGFGRAGTHMWAFQAQGAVPDIVTLGKPIGNGHPIGAVVTTPEIAASFDTGMEFFSTFGGNPVSMAAGLAVLDVIEEEGLMERAGRVGRYLAAGFRRLAGRHPLIGDVRGLGLFMGVELVRDRESLEPATGETARLVERLREEGILLSAEGPFHNVLKIKPPLQFEETEADLLLGAVDRALGEIEAG